MHIYKPNSRFKAPVNKEKCKSAVPDDGMGVGFHQCGRKAVIDGWCKQHHPDAVQKRRDIADAKYEAEAKVRSERARLNRAAPDLLAACERVWTKFTPAVFACLEHMGAGATITLQQDDVDAIRDAIAKAGKSTPCPDLSIGRTE